MCLRNKALLAVMLVLTLFTCVLPHQVFAAATGTHTPVTNVTVSVSDASDNSMSNGAVTVTAKGSAGFFGIGASAKTATITISQDSGSAATVSFDWTATSVNQLTIDGKSYTGTSGSFSKLLDSGTSFTVTITTAKNSTENKLVLNNFAIKAAEENSNVTFQFDSSIGSITVDGNTAASGDSIDIPLSGAALVATPADGATFLGWVDTASNGLLSNSASYTLKPAGEMTVKAAFASVSTNAWFLVDNAYLTDDLNVATTLGAKIVLAADGTLPAGDYTIPSGVTLLIPRDSTNTVYTTLPPYVEAATYVKPTVYRQLTMGSGSNIVVENGGAISVAGMQRIYQTYGYNGVTDGPTGYIKMETGSSITVKSGANLYAWGYIYGSGSVAVESGGTVYESFQVRDYRGGDVTSQLANKASSWRLFPMMQYYVQNVEVPMTLKAGATEKAVMSVYAKGSIQQPVIPFVGANSMFNINSGYIVKDYDEETDRLTAKVYGSLAMNSWTFSIKVALFGNLSLKSEDYVLPLNHNITVDVQQGSSLSIAQDMGLLPGTQILIQEGATCTLTNNAKLYLYDNLDWGKYCGECMTGTADDTTLKPLQYVACGMKVDRWTEDLTQLKDAEILVNGTLDATNGYIYTSTNGASIHSTASGQIILGNVGSSTTYQVTQNSTTITESQISFPGVQPKNGDGTYIAAGDVSVGTYTYVNSKWCKDHNVTSSVTKAATCGEDGVKTFSCSGGCGTSYTETILATGEHTEVTDAAVAATCAEPGLTEGSHCSVCGEVIAAQEEIPALGHNYSSTHTPPTKEANGYITYTCGVCGDSYTEDYAVIAFESISLSIQGETLLNLSFSIPEELLLDSGAYVVWTEEANAVVAEASETKRMLKDWTPGENGLYTLSQGIASGEMTGDVTVQFYDGNDYPRWIYNSKSGTTSVSLTQTVLDYVTLALASDKAELKAMCNAMLTFGGYAQQYFGVDTGNLAYSHPGVTMPTISDYASLSTWSQELTQSENISGITYKGQRLGLDSKVYMTTYFALDDGKSIEDYTFAVSYTEAGNTYSGSIRPVADGERYSFKINDIPPAMWDTVFTITITNKSDTSETYTITCSVLAWARRCIEQSDKEAQVNMAKAMYYFNKTADAYFATK